jgi:hypothetical protein
MEDAIWRESVIRRGTAFVVSVIPVSVAILLLHFAAAARIVSAFIQFFAQYGERIWRQGICFAFVDAVPIPAAVRLPHFSVAILVVFTSA